MKVSKIVIADDEDVYREGLKRVFERQPGLEIIGEAASAQEAIRQCEQLSPDLLIIDLKWAGDDTAGTLAIKSIRARTARIKIIAITAYEYLIRDAKNAGADIGLIKTFRRDELLQLVHGLLSDAKASNLLTEETPPEEEISYREKEVLNLLAKGKSTGEIASLLNISKNTVKKHTNSIYRKLGAKNKVVATIIARERGLLL